MRSDAAAGRERHMLDGTLPVAPIPPRQYTTVKKDAKAEMKHEVLERVAKTISKLCEKVECGTAREYEMETLVDLVKIVAY